MKLLSNFLLLFAVVSNLLANGALTDAQWEQMKKEKLAKPRSLIANNDGCDATAWNPATYKNQITVENFHDYFNKHFKNANASALCYCPFSVGLTVCVPTKTGMRFPDCGLGSLIDISDDLLRIYGKDPMQLSLEFAKENGMEFFGSIRVNDIHDHYVGQWLSDFKKKNPHLLCGTAENRPLRGEWTAFDFAHKEVRDLFVNLVTELMENYEVDGFELDFCRNVMYFKSVAWNKPVTQQEMDGMTDAIRRIRANAERIGRARKRPIIILIHALDNPDINKAMGLDVERWMADGLMDIFVGQSDRGNYNIAADLAALCNKYGVQYYGGITDAYAFEGVFDRNCVKAMHGLQAFQYAAGAKGMWAFNMMYYWKTLIEVAHSYEELKFKSKAYFVSLQHENTWGSIPDVYKKYNKTPELSPRRAFSGARKKDYIIQIGDDFSLPELNGNIRPKLTLYLDVKGPANLLKVLINGHELTPGTPNNTVVPYNVDASILKKGVNILTLDSTSAAGTLSSKNCILSGKSMVGGAPWYSLYPSGPGTKLIDQDAYRLNDNRKEKFGYVSGIRTISGSGGMPLRFDFELQTFPENDPETSVFRVIDGNKMEVVDFRPDEIVLKYAQKSVPFKTADKFHNYTVITDDGKISVSADGKLLFDKVQMVIDAGSDECAFYGHSNFVPPDASVESILIGSMNGPGTGSSKWKNMYIGYDMLVTDAVLHVDFPAILPESIAEVADKIDSWEFDADFSDGKVPEIPGFSSTYINNGVVEGAGMLLDNESNPKNNGMGMFVKNSETACSTARFRVAEWEIKALRASKADPSQSIFQMVFRPGKDMTSFLDATVEVSAQSIKTPFGTLEIPIDKNMKFKMIVDMDTRVAALWLNDKLEQTGKLAVRKDSIPDMFWGDLSATVGGAVALKYVRFTAYPSPVNEIKKVLSSIPVWEYEFNFADGKIPAGLKNTYSGTKTVKNGILLDNEVNPENNGMGISLDNPGSLNGSSRYVVAEFSARPERASEQEASQSVFQFVVRPASGDKKYLNAYVDFNKAVIRSPWGTFPVVPGDMKFNIVIDREQHSGYLFLNGKILASGKLEERQGDSWFGWGDFSSGIGGAAVLNYVRFTAYPSASSKVQNITGNMPGWKYEFNFADGKIPSGLKSTYSATEAVDGGILLDNESNPENNGMGIEFADSSWLNNTDRYIIAEFTAKPERASATDPSQSVFQFVMRPSIGNGKILNAYVDFNKTVIRSSWGVFPTTPGDMNFQIIIDKETQTGYLSVNGKIIGDKKLEIRQTTPWFIWGDLSSGIGGAAILKKVKFTSF